MRTREVTLEGADSKDPTGFRAVTFIIAPTPLIKLAEYRELFKLDKIETPEGLRALVNAIYWGARRAGAQVTLEWLELNVDVHNSPALFDAFREVNELTKRAAETVGNGAAGEAKPAGLTQSSTSDASLPTS